MTHINCEDCLKTYRPYRYGIALSRVLMYGFSNWWEFENERDIKEQLREHLRDHYGRRRIIDRTRTYRRDDSFAENFNFYYQYLENKRRKNISATFLCFDCEKYYCTNCVSKHSGHFTFSKDDKYDIGKWGRISVEIFENHNAEGDQKRENMKRKQTYLCDVVNVRCEHDKLDLDNILRIMKRHRGYESDEYWLWNLDFPDSCGIESLHILNDNKKWLIADDKSICIKIFNVNDNTMDRRIQLSSWPLCITEVPSTDPLQCLIAVSFPSIKQIIIMNIHSTPAQVVSIISIQGACYDLACCNNKLITRYWNYPGGEVIHLIHVMNISGEIISTINLHNLPGIKLGWFLPKCMSVHSESETLYVCHHYDPSCVIGLSLDGQMLHSITFTDLGPRHICVDKRQNVYVMSHQLPIYKLSADLRHREKVIEENIVKMPNDIHVTAMRFHNGKFYLASREGLVYIIQRE